MPNYSPYESELFKITGYEPFLRLHHRIHSAKSIVAVTIHGNFGKAHFPQIAFTTSGDSVEHSPPFLVSTNTESCTKSRLYPKACETTNGNWSGGFQGRIQPGHAQHKNVECPPRLAFAEARLPKVRTYVFEHWAMRRVTFAEMASFDEPSVTYWKHVIQNIAHVIGSTNTCTTSICWNFIFFSFYRL